MEREPWAIISVSIVAGIAYYLMYGSSYLLAASPVEKETMRLFQLWMSLSVTVLIIVVGFLAVSIVKFREKK